MLNLAIECSGQGGSVALLEKDRPLNARILPGNIGSVQSLAPEIAELIPQDSRPDLICVTTGPGSFTGLRVGITTAKMLGMAWNVPLVGVDTLEVIAWPHASQIGKIVSPRIEESEISAPEIEVTRVVVPVLNAFRKQVFSAIWRSGPTPRRLTQTQVVDAGDWMTSAVTSLSTKIVRNEEPVPEQEPAVQQELKQAAEGPVLFCGPGLEQYQPNPMPQYELAPEDTWAPRAEVVGQLGWRAFQAGEADTPVTLRPNYVRASAAEEKARSTRA